MHSQRLGHRLSMVFHARRSEKSEATMMTSQLVSGCLVGAPLVSRTMTTTLVRLEQRALRRKMRMMSEPKGAGSLCHLLHSQGSRAERARQRNVGRLMSTQMTRRMRVQDGEPGFELPRVPSPSKTEK